MDPVSLFLLTIAVIFLVGIAGEVVFEKTSVPDVVWLILVGIVLGPVTGLVHRSMLERIAPFFGALTLVIVLFQGGSRLRLRDLSAAAPRSVLLAIVGFVFSVAAVAVASMAAARLHILPSSWTWMHGVTLGAILGGSSSVVIMPAMIKARLSPRISNLVNLESAFTDILCVVVAAACIRIVVTGSADFEAAALTLGRAFGIGLGVGLLVGLVGLLFLRMLRSSAYGYPLILGTLLVLFVVVDELDGSAPLAVLTVAVLVGNAPALGRAFGLEEDARLGVGVQDMHTQVTFFVKSFFFTFIGAMLAPPWSLLVFGALLGLLLLVARFPAVKLATAKAGLGKGAQWMVTGTLPRGMAAGVLAMLPVHAGMEGTEGLPVLSFATVLATILIFAVAFPLLRKRLGPEDLARPSLEPPRPPGSPAPETQAAPQGGPAEVAGGAAGGEAPPGDGPDSGG